MSAFNDREARLKLLAFNQRRFGAIDFWKGKFGAIERSIGEGIHEARYTSLLYDTRWRSGPLTFWLSGCR